MLKRYMADPALRAEAEMAAANILWDLRKKNPAEVKAMAEELRKSKNKTVAGKAAKALGDLKK